ncbi:MAG: response regulator [Pirellulaceae bacterium]|jgi:CheY-like chemotaxis protein|nr:response regulator [Pirellulaceae bacterium]
MTERSPDSERKNILVVDDSPVPAQIVATVLRNVGYEVSIAHDGQKAWRKVQEQQFDLVLSDEQMPFMSGSELCRRLRTDERYSKIPFVLFTAKRWTTNIDRLAEELDIAATIYKAFRPTELADTVKSVLAREAAA